MIFFLPSIAHHTEQKDRRAMETVIRIVALVLACISAFIAWVFILLILTWRPEDIEDAKKDEKHLGVSIYQRLGFMWFNLAAATLSCALFLVLVAEPLFLTQVCLILGLLFAVVWIYADRVMQPYMARVEASKEQLVKLLQAHGNTWISGYEIVGEMGLRRDAGRVSLLLHELELAGLVESRADEGVLPPGKKVKYIRRLFRLKPKPEGDHPD